MTWRLMLALMGVTAVVLAVLLIPVSSFLVQSEHDRITTGLERDAFVLAGRAEPSLEGEQNGASATITELARRYRQSSGGARVVIVDSAGTAIVTSDDDSGTVGSSFDSRPEIAAALSGRIADGTRYSQTLTADLLYVAVPVLDGDRVLGAVRLTYPAAVVDTAANSKLGGLAIVAAVTVVLAGAIGWLISTSITRRLRRLTETSRLLADGELDRRADERTGAPEIRTLARAFNLMADRLTTSLAQQRRFAADAAHQLRTPLTALRLRLGRARELAPVAPLEAGTRIQAAEEEVDRLTSLIEGLLQLSRNDSTTLTLEDLDVAELATARVAQWEPLGDEVGVTVRYEGPPAVRAHASRTAVEQILDNYIDNALKASAAGGEITVTIEPGAHGDVVHVLDRGPGLSAEDRERAFERFWRGRDTAAGTGLGLAIVAQLAEASSAEVSLSARSGGGTDASLALLAATGRSGAPPTVAR